MKERKKDRKKEGRKEERDFEREAVTGPTASECNLSDGVARGLV